VFGVLGATQLVGAGPLDSKLQEPLNLTVHVLLCARSRSDQSRPALRFARCETTPESHVWRDFGPRHCQLVC